ncbi:uncharacterized protein Dere_GG27071 [Drosophila erecta]|uniref:Uncharacterized protein n=1 Tax=Drosophila erecta TaxID=7220 RepID=A0A0Q5W9L9_DROER|nr:uncharacterized protein Dere_GG27071 [Drosophila erecta]
MSSCHANYQRFHFDLDIDSSVKPLTFWKKLTEWWWCNNCERQKAEETKPRSQINLSSLVSVRASRFRVESRRFLQFESRVVKSVGKSAPCCTTHPLSHLGHFVFGQDFRTLDFEIRNCEFGAHRSIKLKHTLNHISHFQIN